MEVLRFGSNGLVGCEVFVNDNPARSSNNPDPDNCGAAGCCCCC